jgi:hypothetical protein
MIYWFRLTWRIRGLLGILAVRGVVNIWGRCLMQAWDVESILRGRMLQLVRCALRI